MNGTMKGVMVGVAKYGAFIVLTLFAFALLLQFTYIPYASAGAVGTYTESNGIAAPSALNFSDNTTKNHDTDGYITLNWSKPAGNTSHGVIANYSIWISSDNSDFKLNGSNSSAHGYNIRGMNSSNFTFKIQSVGGADGAIRSGINLSWNSTKDRWMVILRDVATNRPSALTLQANTSAHYDEGFFYINWTAPSMAVSGVGVRNYTIWKLANSSLDTYTQNGTNTSLTGKIIRGLEYNYTFRIHWIGGTNGNIFTGFNYTWDGGQYWIQVDKSVPQVRMDINFTTADMGFHNTTTMNYAGNNITFHYNISHKYQDIASCGFRIYQNNTNTTLYAGSRWQNRSALPTSFTINGTLSNYHVTFDNNISGTRTTANKYANVRFCNATIYAGNFTKDGLFEVQAYITTQAGNPIGFNWSTGNETGIVNTLYANRYNAIGIVNSTVNATGKTGQAGNSISSQYLNLSTVANYTTNITIASFFNNTEKTWHTYTYGGALTALVYSFLDTNDAVYLYANKEVKMIRNFNKSIQTDATRRNITIYANVTNASIATNITWNFVGLSYAKTLYSFVTNMRNVTMMSWYNNTDGLMYPYVRDWYFHNTTVVEVGGAVWVLCNATRATTLAAPHYEIFSQHSGQGILLP